MIDRLPVCGKPVADIPQDGQIFIGKAAVRFWTHVQQEVAVLAHHVDQVADQFAAALVIERCVTP